MSPSKKELTASGGDSGDWGQWSNLVLAELKRLNESIEKVREDLTTVTLDVATLKVKSSLWGAMAGAITVIAILGVDYMKENLFKAHNPPTAIYQVVPYTPTTSLPSGAAITPPVGAPVVTPPAVVPPGP